MVTIADLLAEPEAADLPWPIEPRDRDPAPEERRQRVLLADLAKVAPAITVWAVPNAARRTQWEAGKAKREGMKAGALDLTIAWPGGVAFVEMKAGKGDPTDAQRDMLNRLHAAGHHCGVFRTSGAVLAWLKSIGAPVLIRGGSDANG